MRHVPSSSRSTIHGSHMLSPASLAEEAARVAHARRASLVRAGILAMEVPSTTHVVMTQSTSQIRMVCAKRGEGCVCQRSGRHHRTSRANLRREDLREIEEVLIERSSKS